MRGTGFMVTDWVNGTSFITWPQLQEMFANGWTIGNNTKAHANLTALSEADQEAALLAARAALNAHGMTNADYVAYPGGLYNTNTLTAMANLGMHTGRNLTYANDLPVLASPYEIFQRELGGSTTLASAQSWVDLAKSRQEVVVITLYGLSASPTGSNWYVDRFQALVDYCIQQGITIITMDDLYRLQSGSVSIPGAR